MRTLYPEIAVILMSGYDSGEAGRQAAEEMGSVLLNKPFPPSTMLRAVRAGLDAKDAKDAPSDAAEDEEPADGEPPSSD